MGKRRIKLAVLGVGVASLFLLEAVARAGIITLDFDTPATGSLLASTPLTTAAGNVTLTATGGLVVVFPANHPNNGIQFGSVNDADRAILNFAFDVNSVTFDFAGEGAGNFIGQVFNAAHVLLDTFTFQNTTCASCFDGTNVTLTGPGIRSFEFADAPLGSISVFVDNLRLDVTESVPLSGTLALLGLGLAGLGWSRRRK